MRIHRDTTTITADKVAGVTAQSVRGVPDVGVSECAPGGNDGGVRKLEVLNLPGTPESHRFEEDCVVEI